MLMPCCRMHWANFSCWSRIFGSVADGGCPPFGRYCWQAFCAAFIFASSPGLPITLILPPLGSGILTPCWRMHCANFSDAFSMSSLDIGEALADALELPFPLDRLATPSFFFFDPHAAVV